MAENIKNSNNGITNPADKIPETTQVKKQAGLNPNKIKAAAAQFEEFDETILNGKNISGEKLSMLQDLLLNVYIELGRTQLKVKSISRKAIP